MASNLETVLSAQYPQLIDVGPKRSARSQRLSDTLLQQALSQAPTGPWSTLGGLAEVLSAKYRQHREDEAAAVAANQRSDGMRNAVSAYREGIGDQPVPVPGPSEAPHPGLAATEPLNPYHAPGTMDALFAGAEANPAAMQHEQFWPLVGAIAGREPPPIAAPTTPAEAEVMADTAGASIGGRPIAGMTAPQLRALAELEPQALKAQFSQPQLLALAARWDELGRK